MDPLFTGFTRVVAFLELSCRVICVCLSQRRHIASFQETDFCVRAVRLISSWAAQASPGVGGGGEEGGPGRDGTPPPNNRAAKKAARQQRKNDAARAESPDPYLMVQNEPAPKFFLGMPQQVRSLPASIVPECDSNIRVIIIMS